MTAPIAPATPSDAPDPHGEPYRNATPSGTPLGDEIDRLRDRLGRLITASSRARKSLQSLIAEHSDPGAEALAAEWCLGEELFRLESVPYRVPFSISAARLALARIANGDPEPQRLARIALKDMDEAEGK